MQCFLSFKTFGISTMTNTFFIFKDGMGKIFNEHGERVYNLMDGVLTEITTLTLYLKRKRYSASKLKRKKIRQVGKTSSL
ncbi:hypothetical protein BD408DRAFT_408193 [Parasitella parasitica]|nr:hypothetical protein BD408DRAFT_408193 [Parasitella parasitica]